VIFLGFNFSRFDEFDDEIMNVKRKIKERKMMILRLMMGLNKNDEDHGGRVDEGEKWKIKKILFCFYF